MSVLDVTAYPNTGFCILPNRLPADLLAVLDRECDAMHKRLDSEMDAAHTDVIGPTRRGIQYFPGNCLDDQPGLGEFLFSDVMNEVTSSLLGASPYLLWEQFAVKYGSPRDGLEGGATEFKPADGPSSLGELSWHQDSGYMPFDHQPYLTCWVPLDDVLSFDRGPVRVLSFEQVGIRTRVQHVPNPENGDLVGYFGDETGQPLYVRRGDLVCFSSVTFHASTRNLTPQARRAYIAQYSASPVLNPLTDELWNRALPFSA